MKQRVQSTPGSWPRHSWREFLHLVLLCTLLQWPSFGAERLQLNANDIVGFVGAADVVAAQHAGYLETLLTLAYPGVKFRNFGWEGDTVYAQPRDFNFPPLADHLRKEGITVVMVQFGRAEALGEHARFAGKYREMLQRLREVTPRLVLVTPVPFERAQPPLPDLSRRNAVLEKISAEIRAAADELRLPVVDLFSALHDGSAPLTEDGLQLTLRGHALVAQAFAQQIGIPAKQPDEGRASELRERIQEKNGLWFNYWRPQNWAFLGGDRTEQPSSRDHRDPKIRWFPTEIEKFRSLIEEKEKEIRALAREWNER